MKKINSYLYICNIKKYMKNKLKSLQILLNTTNKTKQQQQYK